MIGLCLNNEILKEMLKGDPNNETLKELYNATLEIKKVQKNET